MYHAILQYSCLDRFIHQRNHWWGDALLFYLLVQHECLCEASLHSPFIVKCIHYATQNNIYHHTHKQSSEIKPPTLWWFLVFVKTLMLMVLVLLVCACMHCMWWMFVVNIWAIVWSLNYLFLGILFGSVKCKIPWLPPSDTKRQQFALFCSRSLLPAFVFLWVFR